MDVPPGMVVDDPVCEDDPFTSVRLGKGEYPGGTAGMRVETDVYVWAKAVSD